MNILDEVQKQSGYDFLYSSKSLNHGKRVSLRVANKDLKEVLELLLDNQNLQYEIDRNTVFN